MQYKVPQNIDVEDKIIGPLTLKQFIYILAGGMITLFIKVFLGETLSFLFLPLSLPIIVLFLALAFFKVNDRPFEIFFLSILTTLARPRRRVWKKVIYNPPYSEPQNQKKEKKKEIIKKPHPEKSRLEELSMVVDTKGWGKEDLKKASDEGRVTSSNLEVGQKEEAKATDILEKAEEAGKKLTKIFTKTEKETIRPLDSARGKQGKEKEPLVSEMASVSPDKKFDYSYKEVDKNNEEYERIRQLAKKYELREPDETKKENTKTNNEPGKNISDKNIQDRRTEN